MRTYTAVVEKCPDTGLYIGYVPGFPGAHTQAESLDELQRAISTKSLTCCWKTAIHVEGRIRWHQNEPRNDVGDEVLKLTVPAHRPVKS